jgi:DNA-binding NtrC family response regulator
MALFETTIWIVHRDPGPRGALGRLSGAVRGRHQIVLGRPNDTVFESAAPAHAVVLDVSASPEDLEPELEFVRRAQARMPDCAWVLVADPAGVEATRRLFDTLDVRIIPGPPDARALQRALSSALSRDYTAPLSRRLGRDHLSARFVRWFSHGEPAELALALDPRLEGEPVLARGEVGTGRGLLLRYVHSISTRDAGPFVRVACTETTRPDQLLSQIEDGAREAGHTGGRFGVWLDEMDRLSEALQARVLDWIDFGLPVVLPSSVRGSVRWFASTGRDTSQLDPRLALAFAELTIRTAPLRDHPGIIDAFVSDTARAWCSLRREPAKSFDPPALDLLRSEPWPGNLAELESVVIRSLAHVSAEAETVRIADLRFGPELEREAPAPIAREEAGPVNEAVEPEPAEITEPELPAAEVLEPEPVAEAVGVPEPAVEGVVDAPEIAEAPAPAEPIEETDRASIARLAAAVAHEVRNPLVSIRTFSELLQDHYADQEFRDRFGRLVADDVRRIEEAVERLEQMGEASTAVPGTPVEMTALLESLLDEQRSHIQKKRLLVLKELDRAHPLALGDEEALRTALAALLDHAIEEIPERGDLYLASRHHAKSPEQGTMRILLRYRVEPVAGPRDSALPGLRETVLGHSVANSLIERQGGSLTVDTTDSAETLVVIDLPAPGPDQARS